MSWKELEPVRVYLYSLLGPVVAVLVAYGVVDSELAPLFIALGTAALGVGAVEAARSRVSPQARPSTGRHQ